MIISGKNLLNHLSSRVEINITLRRRCFFIRIDVETKVPSEV